MVYIQVIFTLSVQQFANVEENKQFLGQLAI